MKSPLVSIILVTYNSEEYLEACLVSLYSNIYPQFEVIIVDNNSSDNTKKIILKYQKKFPNKSVVSFNSQNLGYAKANNAAIAMARGDLFFVINPDTIVDKNFLTPLVNEINEKNIAAVQPLVYLFDKKTINLTGKVTHYLGFDWLRDFNQVRIPKKSELFSLSGSGVLLNKKDFLEAGGFDEFYFMYYEDSDLSWKFNLLDKKMVFAPKSILFHDYKYIPKETYQPLQKKLFYIERNRIVTILKNYSIKTLLLLLPMFIFMELGMLIFAFFDRWGTTKLRTYMSILKSYKHIVEKRSFIQSKRKVADSTIFKQFESAITFEKFSNPLIKYVVNPILHIYFIIIEKIV
ncbi:MAG: glycosyl transferase [Patescibacteria group bacterium]|nr:MAG: glycosyl transferase [Patescibacteria group bacterium]